MTVGGPESRVEERERLLLNSKFRRKNVFF